MEKVKRIVAYRESLISVTQETLITEKDSRRQTGQVKVGFDRSNFKLKKKGKIQKRMIIVHKDQCSNYKLVAQEP